MTVELTVLSLLALGCLVLPLVYSPLYSKQVGNAGLMSNRDDIPAPTGAAGRGLRAHRNLIENLVPFAVAVLVAHTLGISNGVTTAGAWLFLAARLVHAITYIAGIKVVRTLSWFAGVIGTLLILSQIFFA
ncbi:MAPEG family protein [Radicibacter daui]|uniref:MAPEG family protein n=1 Tax=Radicibacter daui TaxID=3064829 RepID=UPI00404698B0